MRCECCGQNGKLLEHHWFQPPRYIRRTKKICTRCNNLLVTKDFGFAWREFNHILPNWREQKEYVQRFTKFYEWNEQFETRMRAKYGYHSGTLFIETQAHCKSKGIEPDPKSDSFCKVLAELVRENPQKRLVFNLNLKTRFGKLTQ
ncbi:hypothetical protein ES707_16881 [subsurface metagenome]